MTTLSLTVYEYSVVSGRVSGINGIRTLEIQDLDGDGLINQREIAAYFGLNAQGGVQGTNGWEDGDAEFAVSSVGNFKHPFTLYTTNPGLQIGDRVDVSGMSQNFRPYDPRTDGVPCFSAATMIETDRGLVAGDLVAGDMVRTRDNVFQPVRWMGKRHLRDADLAEAPNLRPIRIKAGAMGPGVPGTDLVVSQQHRVLVRSSVAMRMFGTSEVLVAAKQLLEIEGVDIASDLNQITYVHVLFDDHQIVFANGTETESLYTGPEALKSVGPAARAEIFAIFPELRNGIAVREGARTFASGRRGRQLAARHAKNLQPLVS